MLDRNPVQLSKARNRTVWQSSDLHACGPGSGKTTAALAIVKAVISQPARSSAPPVAIDQADTPKAESDNVNDAEAENLGGHTESDAHGQIDDGLEYTSPDIPPPPALRWTDNKSDNKADGADCAEEETAGEDAVAGDNQIQDEPTAIENNIWDVTELAREHIPLTHPR
ncbi:hypothetical protein NCS52_00064200 [Fusarium sp. LHS14.1]|nr:hypothetical protein NCS52_00064200 [Fusarium sp. LHS14.1]